MPRYEITAIYVVEADDYDDAEEAIYSVLQFVEDLDYTIKEIQNVL